MLTAVGTGEASSAVSAASGLCLYAQYGSSDVVIVPVTQKSVSVESSSSRSNAGLPSTVTLLQATTFSPTDPQTVSVRLNDAQAGLTAAAIVAALRLTIEHSAQPGSEEPGAKALGRALHCLRDGANL